MRKINDSTPICHTSHLASNPGVYFTGFAAGSEHGNKGGGVNYQCLHTQPEYNSAVVV